MSSQVVYSNRIFTSHEELSDSIIVVEGEKIVAVGHRDEVAVPKGAREVVAREGIVAPGFVDVHIHGAGGRDVMEGTPEALDTVCRNVARRGTTSIVATTVSASEEDTCRGVRGIAAHVHDLQRARPGPVSAAEILGIHFEGPFISAVRRGVHPERVLARPSVEAWEKFVEAADGSARMLTLAPELPGAMELISHVRGAKAGSNIVVGMGHTDATFDQAEEAVVRGARHGVHVFNAMRPLSHRETGVLGCILTNPEVTAELIADGIHVDDAAIRILLACKGAENVLLVSDGMAATGMPDGDFRLGGIAVKVSGGVARNEEGRLAGSTLTLDRAVRHMVGLGVPLADALRMASLGPARRLGLGGKKGVIAPGADADLVFLSEDLQVEGVMSRGVGPS
jgi:N-acetylglucosamine-6-phosphate deacetylase